MVTLSMNADGLYFFPLMVCGDNLNGVCWCSVIGDGGEWCCGGAGNWRERRVSEYLISYIRFR